MFFVFFCLFISSLFSVPFIGIPITSQNATKKKHPKSIKIQNPKSKSVEACLPNTCVCPPVCPTASSPKAQTFEPPLTTHFDENFGCLHNFSLFSVIKAAFFFLRRSLDFHNIPKRRKKNRESSPLGGPSPCGKTGLAPWRQCIVSSFFGFVFLI